MAKKKPAPDREQINVRLTPEAVKQLDRLAAHMARKFGLVRLTRSDVIRLAVDQMHERELNNGK